MEVRWTHHALHDKLPALTREYGLVLTKDLIEEVIHDPEWIEHTNPPSATRAERQIFGLPVRVVWRDFANYHLVITLFVAKEPHI